jgi:hypothetical protein
MVMTADRMILPAMIILIVAGIAVYLIAQRRRNKVLRQCFEYAGVDWTRHVLAGGTSWGVLLEGLGREKILLSHRARTFAETQGGRRDFQFLHNVPRILDLYFLAVTEGREAIAIRKEARAIGAAARAKTGLSAMVMHPMDEELFTRILVWAEDIDQWVRTVDEIGREVAENARMEAFRTPEGKL